jgi:hypothetical protein
MTSSISNSNWKKTISKLNIIIQKRYSELSKKGISSGSKYQIMVLFSTNSVLRNALSNNGSQLRDDIETNIISSLAPFGKNEFEVLKILIQNYLTNSDVNFNIINVLIKDLIVPSSDKYRMILDDTHLSLIEKLIGLLNSIRINEVKNKEYYIDLNKFDTREQRKYSNLLKTLYPAFGLEFDSKKKQLKLNSKLLKVLEETSYIKIRKSFDKDIFYLLRLASIRFIPLGVEKAEKEVFIENICKIMSILLLTGYIDKDPADNKFAIDLIDEFDILNNLSKLFALLIGGSDWFRILDNFDMKDQKIDSRTSTLQWVLFFYSNGDPIEIALPIVNRIRNSRIKIDTASKS